MKNMYLRNLMPFPHGGRQKLQKKYFINVHQIVFEANFYENNSIFWLIAHDWIWFGRDLNFTSVYIFHYTLLLLNDFWLNLETDR